MLTSVVGINWGDEGKGRMVDLLSQDYDIVVRYQGGNNAGHTVMNERGRFILNLLPSGILRDETVNVLGPGMVIDMEHLYNEIQKLRDAGIEITPKHLKISDRASICMPYHKLLDCLEEDRLADKKFGSTRRGISPAYSDKYMKKALRVGELLHRELLDERVADIVEWKNLLVEKGYGHEAIKAEDMLAWIDKYCMPFKDYICDTTLYLGEAVKEGKNIMFEAQLGALRDIDYGIFPYTSASYTIASYAPIGAGIPQQHLDEIVGIMKAYSTCVGGFDAVASRYGVMVQGATCLALTKLDVLSYLDRIPVCVAYEVEGKRVDYFPKGVELAEAKPVYEYVPGFKCDISACRKPEELPKEALDYVRYLEKAVGCPIKYVSVGPDRDQYIEMF